MAKKLEDYLARGVYYRRLKPDGKRPTYWEGGMEQIGVRADGSLINPNGYPEDEVRLAGVEESLAFADELK